MFNGSIPVAYGNISEPFIVYPSRDVQSSVSRNQRYIAFVSNRSGNEDIWNTDLLAGRFSPARSLTSSPGKDTFPSLNNDGTRRLYVSHKSDPRGDVYLLDRITGVETKLTDMSTKDSFPKWGEGEESAYYIKYDYKRKERGLFRYTFKSKSESIIFVGDVDSYALGKGGWIFYSDGKKIFALNEADVQKKIPLTEGDSIDVLPETFNGSAIFFTRYLKKGGRISEINSRSGVPTLWGNLDYRLKMVSDWVL